MNFQHIPALSLVMALGLFACNSGGEPSGDAVGEAAAYLSETEELEEESDVSGDMAAGMSEAEADAVAGEEAANDLDPNSADQHEPCDFDRLRERVIANYDQDGDGVVNDTERGEIEEDLRDAARDRPRILRLAKRVRRHAWHAVRWAFDTNGDRVLDDAERAELIAAAEQRCQIRRERILTTYDTNGDGQLSAEERVQFRSDRRMRIVEKVQELLDRYDTDGNLVLDQAERQAMKADLIARARARRAAVKARFDANGDGTLSAEEIDALKAAIREGFANGTRLRDINA